ncbi:hypothetical protein GQ600_12941 [Phytophthora cactorum]|nr:hypothetical protein GQ600_12941 [Phytophthora cactorum]
MRSGRRESFEEEDTVPLLDTVSPEKAAELQKILKQAKLARRKRNQVQPLVYQEVEAFSHDSMETCTEAEQTRADDLAAIWTCKSARPFTAVEDKYFRKYSRHLNSVGDVSRSPKLESARSSWINCFHLRSIFGQQLIYLFHYSLRGQGVQHAQLGLGGKAIAGKHDAVAIKNALQEFMTLGASKGKMCQVSP